MREKPGPRDGDRRGAGGGRGAGRGGTRQADEPAGFSPDAEHSVSGRDASGGAAVL